MILFNFRLDLIRRKCEVHPDLQFGESSTLLGGSEDPPITFNKYTFQIITVAQISLRFELSSLGEA